MKTILYKAGTMIRALRPRSGRSVDFLLLVCGACCVAPFCRGQDLPGAGATELLRSQPFDRITLIDGTELTVEPVSPRPLPVIDPSKDKKHRNDRGPAIPVEGNVIVGRPVNLEMPGSDRQVGPDGVAADEVRVHLLEGAANEIRDFKIKRASIKKIEYFEDLLLAECERRVTTRDYARAFEYCLRVQTRNPNWPGIDDRVNRVLFAEGSRALIDGDGERGLRLLRELLARKRDYPDLLDQIAGAYTKRIERALKLGLYARGRRVLHEFAELAPEHAMVRAMQALYVSKAKQILTETEGLGAPERLDGLTLALRIWPDLENAEPVYDGAFTAEPTLDVAVCDVAVPLGPWVRSPADARVTRLLYRPILVSSDEDARKGKKPGQLAAALESSDLGRRLLLRINPGFYWSDGSRPVSAIDVARDLVDRTDPHSPRYQARWAELLDRVEIVDPARVDVRLNRAPLQAGWWFLGPVGAAHASIDGRVATASRDRPLVSDGAYQCFRDDGEQVELRLHSQGLTPAMPRIKRIRETRLSPGQSMVGALRRGEVSMIDHVPPDQVAGLLATADIKVGRYVYPNIHMIALDGRNRALRSRSLRRALSYAIDRKGLLEDHLLKHPATARDTVADGVFPRGSYADAVAVKPLEAHQWLARMLVAAARKELGGQPIKLNFEYPAIPEVRLMAQKLADLLRAVGIEIDLTEALPSRLEAELRSGRRFDLAYRVLRCNEPVYEAGLLLVPGYDAAPDAGALASCASPEILQLLLRLERASEWPTARGVAIQIDRESRDELPVIPLWQVEDHYAWRDRLKGPAESAGDLYDGIESWEITPWIARDPWKAP